MSKPEQDQFSPRQSAVLEEALSLLVEGGEKALTTAGVARAANCSKESLYKWFGDRDGLLAAMIAYQASKVRTYEPAGGKLTREELRAHFSPSFAIWMKFCPARYRWHSTVFRLVRRGRAAASSAG